MVTMHVSVAINNSKNWKQMGNHLFVINGDLVSVYEGIGYNRFALETVKDLNTTFIVTKSDTWNTVADRFFGTPTAPDFRKVLV